MLRFKRLQVIILLYSKNNDEKIVFNFGRKNKRFLRSAEYAAFHRAIYLRSFGVSDFWSHLLFFIVFISIKEKSAEA